MAPRTHGATDRGRARGQTTQDFVMGIGVFLIVLTFTIGFFPQVMTPYDVGAGADDASLADRVASTVLVEIVETEARNDVDAKRAADYFQHNLSEDHIYENLTAPNTRNINVSVLTLNRKVLEVVDGGGTTVALTGGDAYHNQSAITVTRVITMPDDPGACQPACRLVVRVWG